MLFEKQLVTVDVALEGTVNIQTKVVGLSLAELGQLGIDMLKMHQSDLLIENLGQNVDADILFASLTELDVLLAESLVLGLVQHDLCKDLV